MTVTVQPDLMQELKRQGGEDLVVLSSDPPDRVKAALEAAIPQIYLTGEFLVTGETVIAGQVLSKDGTTRPATDEELETGKLDGPQFVDGPVPIPGGQLLSIDFKYTRPELRQEIPGILARHLEEAGVQNAEIRLAYPLSGSQSRFDFLGSLIPVARAWMYGPYPHTSLSDVHVAPWLLDVATAWLRAQHQPEMELLADVIDTGVPLTWDTLHSVVDNVLASDTTLIVVSSDLQTSAATMIASGSPGSTGVSLCVAGDDWTVEQVAARMRSQHDTIRSVATELSWAGVIAHSPTYLPHLFMSPDEALRDMAEDETLRDTARPSARWYQKVFQQLMRRQSSAPPGPVVRIIGEPMQWMPSLRNMLEVASSSGERTQAVKAVPPPMWYQVLSQELVQQLGGAPPGSVDLGNGSVELTIGEPEQWVPGHPDYDAIHAQGRALFLGRR